MTQFLMGNEAIALGAIRAGINFASGYPGTPSTEILETLAKNKDDSFYLEWSVNEKCALETAAGASYAGLRSLVTMKQVGLNVASDPLMSLNYIGVKGGMVIVVADDPGPISSQTEQDTRHFGKYAKIAVFDPSSPEEAYLMVANAFDFSEKYKRPVLFRPTTRVCHGRGVVEILPNLPKTTIDGFKKDSKWVIFPRLAYQNHIAIEKDLSKMSDELSSQSLIKGNGKKGIVTGGISYAYVEEALKLSTQNVKSECKLLKISAYPFPQKLAESFLCELCEVLVIEELDPVIENELYLLCGQKGINIKISGKQDGVIQNAGELTPDSVKKSVFNFLGEKIEEVSEPELPELPIRPPVLCAGCPHRASFYAVKTAVKGKKAVFSGDIGCYTLGNALPLDMVDTCLCMGAGITIAQGLQRAEPDTLNFAFIGDSTFFHSGITGIINAVYNKTDIIIIILDNSTTAMTGGQPHPGMGKTITGKSTDKINIFDIVKACGVNEIVRCNPFLFNEAKKTIESITSKSGVRVVLFEAPCISVSKNSDKYMVNEKCTKCGICINNLGCPALETSKKKAVVNPYLCTGCGLCAEVCKFGAIEKEGANNGM